MRATTHVTRDLTEHVPGQALIAKLLAEWDAGRIRLGAAPDEVVIDDESRGWYWGVLGERKVAEILATGMPEAFVLHSVPIGSQGADVDHVVITMSGVYTINTKYHYGAEIWTAGHGLLVNRINHSKYLRASVREVARVEERLSLAAGFAVPVYPVIAFVAPSKFTRKAPAEIDGVGIRVTSARDLPVVLRNRREMSDEQIARVINVARNPATWQNQSGPSAPGPHLAREFDALSTALGPRLDPRMRRSAARTAPPAPARSTQKRQSRNVVGRVLAGCASMIVFGLLAVAATLLLPAILAALSSR